MFRISLGKNRYVERLLTNNFSDLHLYNVASEVIQVIPAHKCFEMCSELDVVSLSMFYGVSTTVGIKERYYLYK